LLRWLLYEPRFSFKNPQKIGIFFERTMSEKNEQAGGNEPRQPLCPHVITALRNESPLHRTARRTSWGKAARLPALVAPG
jgi:hypothetical protein